LFRSLSDKRIDLPSKEFINTDQIRSWTGNFGREYTDRNAQSPADLDEFYRQTYGITRRHLNEKFLSAVPEDARILEVGCNMGTQLLMLQEMGYTELYGIEIQSYALELAQCRLPEVELRQASAFSIPYPDQYFDLVFTSGVLIHISPSDLSKALREIYRCSRSWIWGFEYYSANSTEISYRGHNNLLWKMDYASRYLQEFSHLELIKEQRIRYLESTNVDSMFLLKRMKD
jgi:pseudaminic acid biosynthesis-associated methylase